MIKIIFYTLLCTFYILVDLLRIVLSAIFHAFACNLQIVRFMATYVVTYAVTGLLRRIVYKASLIKRCINYRLYRKANDVPLKCYSVKTARSKFTVGCKHFYGACPLPAQENTQSPLRGKRKKSRESTVADKMNIKWGLTMNA